MFPPGRRDSLRTVTLVVLFIVGSIAVLITLPQTALAQSAIDDADRAIAEATAEPGEEVEITVSVLLGDGAADLDDDQNFGINEQSFDPEFASSSPIELTYNGDSITGGPTLSTGELLFVGLEQDNAPGGEFSAGDEIVLTYTVTVPSDATDGEEFVIDGVAQIGEEELSIGGDDRITVTSDDGDGDDGADDEGTDDDPADDGDADDGEGDDSETDDGDGESDEETADDSDTDDDAADGTDEDGDGDDSEGHEEADDEDDADDGTGQEEDADGDADESADDGETEGEEDEGEDTDGVDDDDAESADDGTVDDSDGDDGEADSETDDGATDDGATDDGATDDGATDDDGAGFGIIVALVALVAAFFFARRNQ